MKGWRYTAEICALSSGCPDQKFILKIPVLASNYSPVMDRPVSAQFSLLKVGLNSSPQVP